MPNMIPVFSMHVDTDEAPSCNATLVLYSPLPGGKPEAVTLTTRASRALISLIGTVIEEGVRAGEVKDGPHPGHVIPGVTDVQGEVV